MHTVSGLGGTMREKDFGVGPHKPPRLLRIQSAPPARPQPSGVRFIRSPSRGSIGGSQDTLNQSYSASLVRTQGALIRKEVEHELKLGLKSKIEETEAMWHMLNTMFKNIEREFRYVDAILKSLEANGEQGEKHGLGAVTAACLEVKSRMVRVHKAFEVEASISAEEASRDDGVLNLLHGETQDQLKMRALLKANLVQAKETAHVLQLFRDE